MNLLNLLLNITLSPVLCLIQLQYVLISLIYCFIEFFLGSQKLRRRVIGNIHSLIQFINFVDPKILYLLIFGKLNIFLTPLFLLLSSRY